MWFLSLRPPEVAKSLFSTLCFALSQKRLAPSSMRQPWSLFCQTTQACGAPLFCFVSLVLYYGYKTRFAIAGSDRISLLFPSRRSGIRCGLALFYTSRGKCIHTRGVAAQIRRNLRRILGLAFGPLHLKMLFRIFRVRLLPDTRLG
jgi:hypothetical protein